MSKSVFLLLIQLFAGFHEVYPENGEPFQRVYQTEESLRQSKSQEMRRYLNENADPCTDFYEYACGNWKAEGTPQSKLEHTIDKELIRLLEESPHGKDSAVARQAKEFYKSCLTVQSRQNQQQQIFLSEFIQQNGGFPAVPGSNWPVYHQGYDWLQVLGKLRKNYGIEILIGLRVAYNYNNVQENSIYLSEPTTLIPRELCTHRKLDIRDEVYASIEQLVATQLKTWLAMETEAAERLAAEIVSLEHELCGEMQEPNPWDADLNLYKANYTRKSLAELGHTFGMDFDLYVTNSFGQSVFRPVYMAAPKYYQQLKRTVDAHNVSQLANYIMYRAIASITFPLDDNPGKRPAHCLSTIKRLLPSALGELHARQYASEEVSQKLRLLYDQLQAALKQSLNANWLEEGSRRIAQQKLSNLQLMFPVYERPLVLNLQHERNNYWHNLRQLLGEVQSKQLGRLFEENLPLPPDPVESYETRVVYRPVQRRLELGWALPQPPGYDESYGNALRYATVGFALSKQMVKAFDEMHWSVGLLERDNWDAYTASIYHNRSKCFYNHVEEYIRANQSATDELISGSAGLSVAFHAYLTWLGYLEPNNDFTKLRKETLPGLNYSNTALFFLAFAQQHCNSREHSESESEPDLWSTFNYSVRQRHSWTRLLVNGPLRNLPDFAKEFHCPAGTPMNPAEKCIIY